MCTASSSSSSLPSGGRGVWYDSSVPCCVSASRASVTRPAPSSDTSRARSAGLAVRRGPPAPAEWCGLGGCCEFEEWGCGAAALLRPRAKVAGLGGGAGCAGDNVCARGLVAQPLVDMNLVVCGVTAMLLAAASCHVSSAAVLSQRGKTDVCWAQALAARDRTQPARDRRANNCSNVALLMLKLQILQSPNR